MPASGPRRPRAQLVLAVVAACLALAGIVLALVLALGSPAAGHVTQRLPALHAFSWPQTSS